MTIRRKAARDTFRDRRPAPRLHQAWAIATEAGPGCRDGPMKAIDLAYRVRLREDMLGGGSLTRSDTLTFAASALPWLDQ